MFDFISGDRVDPKLADMGGFARRLPEHGFILRV
jgi:hypothetical protein